MGIFGKIGPLFIPTSSHTMPLLIPNNFHSSHLVTFLRNKLVQNASAKFLLIRMSIFCDFLRFLKQQQKKALSSNRWDEKREREKKSWETDFKLKWQKVAGSKKGQKIKRRETEWKWVNQCDQMARLFLQYLAIYISQNWPNRIKNSQRRFKILPNTK